MNEKDEVSRTGGEAPSEKLTTKNERSSLERLAAFTQRILRVPKGTITDR